ncbi:MAG: 16S rRNA (guanine(966)-N(2))-methyltransferase RsmD [Endomicrobium sp.]|jgi:16S rRNA (guanine(966)-N(2))-methyltransferase RsmD|nr:16S rRNA (guanine(966)-N(2))-methyltransferase RsmD [Endomicrobium sp.]
MSLKVLAGIVKGRKLKTPSYNTLSIRPILGRIKKSIFDIIQAKLKNSIFIDLFAGVGTVGIEALSRGAKRVTFVDINDVSLSIIRHNIDVLGFNNVRIVKCNIMKNLQMFLYEKYDIIFMGPPYNSKKYDIEMCHVLRDIVRYNILKDDSILIVQKHIKEHVGDVYGLECFRIKKYGDTIISFYKKN